MEREKGHVFKARLGANENGFGASPQAIAVMKAEMETCWQYGDPEDYDLKQALSQFHQIPADSITIGAGVDALLGLVVRYFISDGATVINSLGGYPTFNYHVVGFGGKLVTVPYKDDRVDLKMLAQAAIQHKAKIVYLANPDNPLGTWHDKNEIEGFLDAIPDNILVILDEAYCEMMPESDLLPLLPLRSNVLRMRTFSKAYGLAGLRCGYVIGPANIINDFEKIRDHFAMNRIVQKGAVVALQDRDYFQQVLKKIALARKKIVDIASNHGLSTLPSATNFVAVDCGRDGDFATRVYDGLIARGIFIRKPYAPVIDRLIRVSVGPDLELDFFAEALGPALKDARG